MHLLSKVNESHSPTSRKISLFVKLKEYGKHFAYKNKLLDSGVEIRHLDPGAISLQNLPLVMQLTQGPGVFSGSMGAKLPLARPCLCHALIGFSQGPVHNIAALPSFILWLVCTHVFTLTKRQM